MTPIPNNTLSNMAINCSLEPETPQGHSGHFLCVPQALPVIPTEFHIIPALSFIVLIPQSFLFTSDFLSPFYFFCLFTNNCFKMALWKFGLRSHVHLLASKSTTNCSTFFGMVEIATSIVKATKRVNLQDFKKQNQ